MLNIFIWKIHSKGEFRFEGIISANDFKSALPHRRNLSRKFRARKIENHLINYLHFTLGSVIYFSI